eukprot:COSAG06_NODE_30083_length_545_cov_0.704036_2_plen_92_part_01
MHTFPLSDAEKQAKQEAAAPSLAKAEAVYLPNQEDESAAAAGSSRAAGVTAGVQDGEDGEDEAAEEAALVQAVEAAEAAAATAAAHAAADDS